MADQDEDFASMLAESEKGVKRTKRPKVGDLVKGKVCRASTFGMFVEVAPGVEALCHNSEVPGFQRGQDGKTPALPVNEEFSFKIIRLNVAEKKIGLSLKAAAEDEEKTRLADYQKQAAAATTTIEEALRSNDADAAPPTTESGE